MNQNKEEHQVGFVGPGSVTSMRMLHREEKWPDSMGKLCPTQRVLRTWLTYNCSNVAEGEARPSSCGTSWMDSYGTFLERGVFTASQTHHFLQHGLVGTPDRVGDSSTQPGRLQSFRQVHSLQGTQPNAEKGKWSLD